MRFSDLLKNPCTEWLYWLYRKSVLERSFPGLQLRYLAKAHNCRFGNHNVVRERTVLVDCVLGDFTYISEDCVASGATFGKFCSVGPYTRMGLGTHPVEGFVSTHPAFYSTRNQAGTSFADRDYFVEKIPITIGNDVWIGANVMITDGVRIGDGAIIAAGAIVTKDVPPYMIAGGIPAKPIRARFPAEEVSRLQSLAWWNKDEAWIRENFQAFHDIGNFFSRLDALQ